MKLRLLLAGLSACSTLLVSTTVWAVAQPPCVPATMTPKAAAIPANIPAFGYNALTATTSDVHLLAGVAKTELPLTVGPAQGGLLKVAPTAALTPGQSYELQFNGFCTYGAFPAVPLKFTAQAEAPLPTKLGDLQSGPTVALKDFGTTRYTITATYSVAPEMKPWSAVYDIFVVLDGKLVATKPTFNAAGDSVQLVATGRTTSGNSSRATAIRSAASAPTISALSSSHWGRRACPKAS